MLKTYIYIYIYFVRTQKFGGPNSLKIVKFVLSSQAQVNRYLFRKWGKASWAQPEDLDKEGMNKSQRLRV